MSEEKRTPCPVKCPWCGAECHRCTDDPRGMFDPYHVWECQTWQRDAHFDRARVCEVRCEERAKFHADLAEFREYIRVSNLTNYIAAKWIEGLMMDYAPAKPEKGKTDGQENGR